MLSGLSLAVVVVVVVAAATVVVVVVVVAIVHCLVLEVILVRPFCVESIPRETLPRQAIETCREAILRISGPFRFRPNVDPEDFGTVPLPPQRRRQNDRACSERV
jgi:hypothetical protein